MKTIATGKRETLVKYSNIQLYLFKYASDLKCEERCLHSYQGILPFLVTLYAIYKLWEQ